MQVQNVLGIFLGLRASLWCGVFRLWVSLSGGIIFLWCGFLINGELDQYHSILIPNGHELTYLGLKTPHFDPAGEAPQAHLHKTKRPDPFGTRSLFLWR